MKIYRDPLSTRTLWGQYPDTKPSFTNTFKVWTVNAKRAIQIAVFGADREAQVVKCLTPLVKVLTSLFSQLINFEVHPWNVHKTWQLKKADEVDLFPNLMSENADNKMLSRCIRSTGVQKNKDLDSTSCHWMVPFFSIIITMTAALSAHINPSKTGQGYT